MIGKAKRIGDEDLNKVAPRCFFPQYEFTVSNNGGESVVRVTCRPTAEVMVGYVSGSATVDAEDLDNIIKSAKDLTMTELDLCSRGFYREQLWDNFIWETIVMEFQFRHEVDPREEPFASYSGPQEFRAWLQSDDCEDDEIRNHTVQDLIREDRFRKAIEAFVAHVYENCGKRRTAYRMEVEYSVTGTGYVWVVADSEQDAYRYLRDGYEVDLESDLDVEVDRYKDEEVSFEIGRYADSTEDLDCVGETAEEEWADRMRRTGDCEAVYIAPVGGDF